MFPQVKDLLRDLDRGSGVPRAAYVQPDSYRVSLAGTLGCKPMLPGTMARCRTDITVIGRAGPPRRRLAPDAWLASPAGEPVCVPGSVVSAELDPRVLNRARGGGAYSQLSIGRETGYRRIDVAAWC